MFLVGVSSGLWATTACDLYGPHRFFWIHAFMECVMPAAIIHLALVFPETSRWVRRHPFLQWLPYVFALLLALFYEIRLYFPHDYVLAHALATYFLALAIVSMLVLITVWYVRTENMMTKQRIRVLFLGYCNLCLPHASLRQPLPRLIPTKGNGSPKKWQPRTPAMAADLTDHVWSVGEFLLFRVPPWRQEGMAA